METLSFSTALSILKPVKIPEINVLFLEKLNVNQNNGQYSDVARNTEKEQFGILGWADSALSFPQRLCTLTSYPHR